MDELSAAESFGRLHGLLDRVIIDGFEVDFVSWGYFPARYWRNYPHTHSYLEVCLAYAGSGRFTVADHDHRVGTGMIFIARPGEVHEIVSDVDDPLGIAFWGFTLSPGRRAMPSRPGWWRGLTRHDRPVVSDQLGQLPTMITALAREGGRRRSGQRPSLTGLATALVIDTARAFAVPDDLAVAAAGPEPRTALVATMERYLIDNLARPVAVRDVAAVVHLSDRHAERLFRSETSESLGTALRRLRLERAARLLIETDLPIGQLARDCGYPAQRPFSTAFRRHFGQPPSRFRATGGTLHLDQSPGSEVL